MRYCEFCKNFVKYKYKYEGEERTKTYCGLINRIVGNASTCNKFERDPFYEVRE